MSIFISISYAAAALTLDPDPICQDSKKYTLAFKGGFDTKEDYTYALWKPNTDTANFGDAVVSSWKKPISTQEYVTYDIAITESATVGQWHYKLWLGKGLTGFNDPNRLITSGDYNIYPKEACAIGIPILEMLSPVKINDTVPIKVRNINPDSDYLLWFVGGQTFINGKFPASSIIDEKYTDKRGEEKSIKTAQFSVQIDNNPGDRTLCLKHGSTNFLGFGKDNCEISIPIRVDAQEPQVTPAIVRSGELTDSLEEVRLFSESGSKFPSYVDRDFLGKCPDEENQSGDKCIAVKTAVGSISTDPAEFTQRIFSLVLGIAGGIALILIIISGYRMMASQGNPEALTAARGQLISTIVGLLFIILSFVILQVIGVDILKIPGFTP